MDVEAILKDEVQKFIVENIHTDINKLILKKSPFTTVNSKQLAQQIQSRKAIQKKLPSWFNTSGILYPPKLNLEQSSSEATAKYKSKLIDKGTLIDLSGGFGVDDFYFAKTASKVHYCEINADLAPLVQHNLTLLGASNIIFHHGDSTSILENIDGIDVIYVDPSRRSDVGNRVFLFEDCEPNLVSNLDYYFKKADKIIVKAAPMLDIESAVKELGNISEIHIVSLYNECKEILFVLEKEVSKTIELKCALLSDEGENIFSFEYGKEKELNISYTDIDKYLYEPDAAILKAGLFKSMVPRFGVSKIHQHSHLYTSDILLSDFPGRCLKVLSIDKFKHFNKTNIHKKANIVVRNFPHKPDELKKKLKINDGGDLFLYFTTDKYNDLVVISCEKTS